MKQHVIIEKLTSCGFMVLNQESWGKTRLNDGKRGSLYVADNYLSATGQYAKFKENVPTPESDHKGYPVWKNTYLIKIIDFIGKNHGDAW